MNDENALPTRPCHTQDVHKATAADGWKTSSLKTNKKTKMLLHSSKPSFKDYFCSRKRTLWRKDGEGTGIRTRQLYAKVQPGPVFVVVEVVDKVRRGAIDQAKQTNKQPLFLRWLLLDKKTLPVTNKT